MSNAQIHLDRFDADCNMFFILNTYLGIKLDSITLPYKTVRKYFSCEYCYANAELLILKKKMNEETSLHKKIQRSETFIMHPWIFLCKDIYMNVLWYVLRARDDTIYRENILPSRRSEVCISPVTFISVICAFLVNLPVIHIHCRFCSIPLDQFRWKAAMYL